MAFFSKLFGEGEDKAESSDSNRREHERKEAQGETITLLVNGFETEQSYPLRDISEGGMRVGPYEGPLGANQYFEFRLRLPTGEIVDGIANVVRVFGDNLAAKFPPQPKMRKFLRDYFG